MASHPWSENSETILNCVWQMWKKPTAERSALFWDNSVVIVYRCFGKTYRSHLHGSRVRVGKKESQQPITQSLYGKVRAG
jgi:hypothetical protein